MNFPQFRFAQKIRKFADSRIFDKKKQGNFKNERQ